MRLIETPEMMELYEMCKPYLILKGTKRDFVEGTPEEIKKAYEKWSKLWDEMFEEAEKLNMI